MKTFDNIKHPEFYFIPAMRVLKHRLVELKKEKGDVEHFPSIKDCDIWKKIYSVNLSSATVKSATGN